MYRRVDVIVYFVVNSNFTELEEEQYPQSKRNIMAYHFDPQLITPLHKNHSIYASHNLCNNLISMSIRQTQTYIAIEGKT